MLTPLNSPEDALARIRPTVHRLGSLVWRELPVPLSIEATEPTRSMHTLHEAAAMPRRPLAPPPLHWGRMFDQRWCVVTLAEPAPAGSWLWWRGQGETTVYADGVALGGTDASRRHVRLPAGVREVWVEWVAENVGIWVPEGEDLDPWGCRFDGAALCRRDDAAWRAQVDLGVFAEVLEIQRRSCDPRSPQAVPWGPRPRLDRATPLFRAMLLGVDRAIDAFEREGADALAAALEALTASLRGGDPRFEVWLSGHAHIDLVWRWPRRVGAFKAVHTFANALSLMDDDESMTFAYSQPASYEAVAQRSPETLDRVRARVAEGRWEAAGMTYVESDTQLACGEALARSFLLGQRGFAALTGAPSRVLWLPDAFGFSGCLPQLVRECGGIGFFSTKPQWSTTTRFPHAAFVWRGQDGSEIVGFVPGDFDYNGEATPERVHQAAVQQRQAALYPRSLVPTGIGDGGGGPTDAMCRRAAVMADLAGLPRTNWGSVNRFFEELSARSRELPVWEGEIGLEYHRGVQTTGRAIKSAFRGAERALQAWEAAAAARGAGPIDESAWKRMVFAQFHDDVPGSSCGEVYAEHVPELLALAERCNAEAASLLAGPGDACLFNPLAIPRVVTHGGARLTLPPLSGVRIAASVAGGSRVTANEAGLESDRVRVGLDRDGLITRVEVDGVPLPLAGPAGGVVTFADRPHAFEAWDIDRGALERGVAAGHAERVHVETAGDGEGALRVDRDLPDGGRLTTRVRLVAGEPVVRLEYRITTERPDRLYKAVFPTACRGHAARYGAPFGAAMRSQRPGRPGDDAAFEVPGSRWASVCDDAGRRGAAVVTASSYGFGCEGGLLHASLLRTALVTDVGLRATLRREDAGPTHFDLGTTVVEIALGAAGSAVPWHEQPAALAETLYTPATAYRGAELDAGLLAVVCSPGVVPAWAKPADDRRGWILRCHETLGAAGEVSLRLREGWTATRTDLMERARGDAAVGSAASFGVGAYAFASIRVAPVS